MNDEVHQQVLNTIEKIETTVKSQNAINLLWGEMKNLFLSEMAKLPDLPSSQNKNVKNKFRKSKEFWNEELEEIWKKVCKTEEVYL